MRIRSRLTLYFTALVMTLILVGSLITYFAIYNYHENDFRKRLHAKSLTTAELLIKLGQVDSSLAKIIGRTQYDILVNENVEIYDSLNRQIYTNNDTVNFTTTQALFDDIRNKRELWYTEGPYDIVGINWKKFGDYVVLGGAIDKEGDELLRQLRITLVSIFLAANLVVIVAGWLFVSQSLEPISSIISKVETLSPVERSERLPVLTEKDEIAALILTFNLLFDKLEDSFRTQKNFVANVSHELKNPLTKIKSQVEVSLIQKRDNESYMLTMQSILEDVNELIDLIQDLLQFSRLAPEYIIAHTPFRIDDLLGEVRDIIIAHFPTYKIEITFPNLHPADRHYLFYANKPLFTTAIKNIVENACKFSQDKTAHINLVIEGETTYVSIQDSGPGIPANEIPYIFELFYRSPSMEVVKGYGIGLALAHRILKAHRFPVKVESVVGVGTTFTISFSN